MKKFTAVIVIGVMLVVTGVFNASLSISEETMPDSPEMAEPVDEDYNPNAMAPIDDEEYETEVEPEAKYQDEMTTNEEEVMEGYTEEAEEADEI